MSATYYLLLTEYGQSKIAQMQTGQPILLTSLAIGDANNQPYLPESRLDETSLVHECARVLVQSVVAQANALRVTATIGSEIGGFNIHELALLDDLGNAVYIGNYHGQFKPQLSQGAGGEIELLCEIVAEGLGDVFISYDPLVVSASKQWVADGFVSKASITAQVAYFAKNTAPEGWLKANGAIVSRTTYARLFSEIGTNFGEGDGLTTFQIPDLRGEFLRGFDDARGVDAGRGLGSFQKATSVMMGDPSHTAQMLANLYNTLDDNTETMQAALNGELTTVDQTNLSISSSKAAYTDGVLPAAATMSVRPRNVALLACIKY